MQRNAFAKERMPREGMQRTAIAKERMQRTAFTSAVTKHASKSKQQTHKPMNLTQHPVLYRN
jgi:hypothetical protein